MTWNIPLELAGRLRQAQRDTRRDPPTNTEFTAETLELAATWFEEFAGSEDAVGGSGILEAQARERDP